MSEIGRRYLWSLAQVAARVADYMEGITPDHRDLLEALAQVPNSVDEGWLTGKALRETVGLAESSFLDIHPLTERGLAEAGAYQGVWCYRLTDAGVDLLARIEKRLEKDELLIRVRQEWKRTVQPRKRWYEPAATAKSGQIAGEQIRAAVIGALAKGPMGVADIARTAGLTPKQVENQIYRLRTNNTVVHLQHGLWALRSQSKEGAA